MISELILYHGTERSGFDKPRAGSFFTESRAEALAYTEITDTDSDRSLRYLSVAELPLTTAIPSRVDWNESWPDYFDYVGEPHVLAVNGNTGRLFFWDGTTNPVGDKNIVVLSGAATDSEGVVVRCATTDDEGITPRVLIRRLFTAHLDIRNPITLPWDTANLLGRRLGAKPDQIEQHIASWRAQGFDGIATFSDDAAFFAGRKIRQFVPFDPAQIRLLHVEDLGLPLPNAAPLPAANAARPAQR